MTETLELVASGMRRQITSYREAIAGGMPRLGWKVGFNDPAAQQRMGLAGPIVGWLDGRRVFEPGNAYTPPAGAKPRVEAETGILIGQDVPADASVAQARASIAAVAPAIEFVNATKPLTPIDELLAHGILRDAVMFGPQQSLAAASKLVESGFPTVRLNGEPHRQGIAGRYPDDLAEIVVAVAATLAEYGEALKAGDWIIGGSYIDPFDVVPGDRIDADFGALGKLAFTVA